MRPLRGRLEDARRQSGAPWVVIERDYILSWVIAGIAQVPGLAGALAFKGGTALKKCYFGDYRFSEDLDFSTLRQIPTGDELEALITAACASAEELLDEYAPVRFECSRYTERDPHPGDQQAFTIRAQLPWHRGPQVKTMVEITTDEHVLLPPVSRPVIHGYGEPLTAEVQVYSLEEVVAEKLRAILQHIEKLKDRGWSRSPARDYYDLWRVLGAYEAEMDFRDFRGLLRRKCDARGVTFSSSGDFFQPAMLEHVARTWEDWLGPLVPGLPAFDVVVGELEGRIERLVAGG